MKNNLSLVNSNQIKSLEFIGQKNAIERILSLSGGNAKAGKAMSNVVILGPSGCGKTLLARNLANKLGAKYYSIMCSKKTNREYIAYIVEKMVKGDILHFDECHALTSGTQEILYSLIDNQCIPRDSDPLLTLKVPEITLIFTTNHPGLLNKELRNRLITIELEAYSLDDIKQIIRQASKKGVFV